MIKLGPGKRRFERFLSKIPTQRIGSSRPRRWRGEATPRSLASGRVSYALATGRDGWRTWRVHLEWMARLGCKSPD